MLLVKHAYEANPLLAHLLRVSIVPRNFDESLLAMLSDRTVDDEEFSVAVRNLLAMPFVVRRHDGRYRIHDEIRRALFERFEETDQDRRLLHKLNERLAAYYAAEHERARVIADQFDSVARLLREVSPGRLLGMRSAIEGQLVRPLVEAQHHVTVVDPSGAGLTQFRRWFELYENEGRVGVCRLLLRSWRDDLERLSGDAGISLYDWRTYYQGRLALAEKDRHGAIEIATELLAQPKLLQPVRLLSQQLVTESLVAECRFAEALEQTDAAVALDSNGDLDAETRRRIFTQQATIHRFLYDSAAQAVSLKKALHAARSAQNRDAQAAILNQLSALCATEGDIPAAANYALQALHVVRTSRSPDSTITASKCAAQLMRTFGAHDPRLADLFHIEASQLTRGDDTRGTAQIEIAFASTLTKTCHFERAHNVLDRLETRLSDQRLLERSGASIVRANLLEAEGRDREAVELYRRTVAEVERKRGDTWDRAVALTNAAETEMNIADLLDEAWSSAMRARRLWVSMGHERGIALTNAVMAEVSRRRADYTGAMARLGSERPLPGLGFEEPWYWTSARLAADLGRRDEAADYLKYVLDRSFQIGRLRAAARAAALLVELLIGADRYDAAVEVKDVLTDVMRRLGMLRQYQQTRTADQADEHNGRAVRLLSGQSNRSHDAVRSAIQHLEEAISADPGPFWYSLNLSYAFFRLGDKEAVREAMDTAEAKAVNTPFEQAVSHIAEELANSSWGLGDDAN